MRKLIIILEPRDIAAIGIAIGRSELVSNDEAEQGPVNSKFDRPSNGLKKSSYIYSCHILTFITSTYHRTTVSLDFADSRTKHLALLASKHFSDEESHQSSIKCKSSVS